MKLVLKSYALKNIQPAEADEPDWTFVFPQVKIMEQENASLHKLVVRETFRQRSGTVPPSDKSTADTLSLDTLPIDDLQSILRCLNRLNGKPERYTRHLWNGEQKCWRRTGSEPQESC
jgi:hypothetical protein